MGGKSRRRITFQQEGIGEVSSTIRVAAAIGRELVVELDEIAVPSTSIARRRA